MSVSKIINKIVFSDVEPDNPYVIWMVKDGAHYNFRYFQDGIWEPILVTKEELEALVEQNLDIQHIIEEAVIATQDNADQVAEDLSASNLNVATMNQYMNATEGFKTDTYNLKQDVIGLKQDTQNIKDDAANIVSGGPKGHFATLADLILADPDHQWTYVTTDNGHWNYYNNASGTFVSGGIYQSPLNVVQELGYSDVDVISQLAITDKIDSMDASITEILEELVTKFDGAYAENGLLYLTANGVVIGQGIEVGSGTGGGGGSAGTTVVIRVTSGYSGTFAVAKDAPALLHYTFTSVYSDDNTPTGNGTANIYVNSRQVAVRSIAQGDGTFDVQQYLNTGANTVNMSIIDALGSSRVIQYSITVVSIEISSTFDNLIPYNTDILFKYIPVGTLEKTIKFFMDGVQIGQYVTNYSGRQLTQTIPVQSHGSHILEVYIEAEVNGIVVTSNTLHYDIMYNIEGNTTPIISSSYVPVNTIQFETISIPYIVYSPLTLNSTVTLELNGEVVSTVIVDRTLQTWNYKTTSGGNKEMTIRCGNVSKTFNVLVEGSYVTSEAETQDLELYLTAVGRSNNEIGTLNEWKFGNIEAELTGFNHSIDGWITDPNGDATLRISGDARVFIPLNIFSTDFRTLGKTIEFEFATRDINDFYAIPIHCWSGMTGLERGFYIKVQEAFFRSDLTSISTKFKEGERVRVSYVIDEKTTNRLISIYINGILSGVVQYPLNDNFIQQTPVGITIGTNGCTTDIYNIRVYNNNLNEFQLLDNYIADMDNVDLKLALFTRNQLFDTYGEIVYSKVLDQIPCMTIIGDLPQYKGNKKNVAIVYEDLQTPTNSFTIETKTGKTNIDVQGTSSQYYPRKNYKLSFDKGTLKNSLGEIVADGKYKLRSTSIAVPTFTMKADFAESSGTHNTGIALLGENILKEMDYLTPPQVDNPLVRTTVEGFPIVIFHKATPDSPRTFLGKYNFNCDKGSTDAFGFTLPDVHQSWEFLNNTSERCLFLSDDFTSLQPDGVTPAWASDFEARYPDDATSTAHLQTLFTWVVGCNPNTATNEVLPEPVALPFPDPLNPTTYTTDSADYRRGKFKSEFTQHFNKNNILSYYLITELFGMVDQRAKNQFLTSWGNEGSGEYKWYMILYDNDTALGINNEGALVSNYNIEYHDTYAWNGEASLLWNLVEQCFSDDLLTMYQSMRSTNAITYNKALEILNEQQAFKWAESIYNLDGKYKYIDPMTIGYYDSSVNAMVKTSAFLYALQGSRTEHRKWFLFNRFRYIDSKYTAGDYQNDFATMRLYYPEGELPVPVNHDFTLTPFADQYTRVKFGSYLLGDRSYADTPITIAAPVGSHFNDTETIVYGASRITSIGDLSPKYPGTVDLSKATNLTEVIIGNGTAGYRNPNLKSLSLGNNSLLRVLNILNCSFDAEHPLSLDLSNCLNIEEIYAKGVENLTTFTLGNGGNLKTLEAPNCLNNITLLNQPYLNNLTIEGVNQVTSIRIENCPLVDIQSLIETCMALDPVVLFRVRLLGVNWTLEDETFLYTLRGLHGFDEYDNITPYAVLGGTVTINSVMNLTTYDNLCVTFPECTFIVPNLIDYSISIVGSSTINGQDVYQVEFSDVDYGLYETERKSVTASIIQNGESVTLTTSPDGYTSYISTNAGVLSNPEGGIILQVASNHIRTTSEVDKTVTKQIDLVGFLESIAIVGSNTIDESGQYQYTVEFTPSDTFQDDITWSVTSGNTFASIDVNTGLLTTNSVDVTSVEASIKVISDNNNQIFDELDLTIMNNPFRLINIKYK